VVVFHNEYLMIEVEKELDYLQIAVWADVILFD
jgi:hypothetical protein